MRRALDERVPGAAPTVAEIVDAIGPLTNAAPTASVPSEGHNRRSRRDNGARSARTTEPRLEQVDRPALNVRGRTGRRRSTTLVVTSPAERPVVVRRIVLGAADVPDRQSVPSPPAAGEDLAHGVPVEVAEQCPRLDRRPAVEPRGVHRVRVERRPARAPVPGDDGVDLMTVRSEMARSPSTASCREPIQMARPSHQPCRRGESGPEEVRSLLPSLRQRPTRLLVRPDRVAAVIRHIPGVQEDVSRGERAGRTDPCARRWRS